MDAIGLNPIKLDAIGLDPIRMNAIRLGVPGASSGSARPYIDPELLSHVKMAISTWGKTNDDPDRTVLKDLSGNGNDMRLLNFGFAEGSGYGLPGTDFEGWLCTDGVDDMIVSEKTVDEMIGDSKECTVISIINYISDIGSNHVNVLGKRFIRNMFERNGINGKYYICGYTSINIDEIGNVTVVNDILGDKTDFVASYPVASGVADYFSVTGYLNTDNVPQKCIKIAYAGGFIANKVLTTDEINQIIAYFNLDRPGQIIKPQLYYNIKKQGITNDNHAEFNDQLIDFLGGRNIQLNNVAWEGESGIGNYHISFNSSFTKAPYVNIVSSSKIIANNKKSENVAIMYHFTINKIIYPSFAIRVSGLYNNRDLLYRYIDANGNIKDFVCKGNGTYMIPASHGNLYTGSNTAIGFLTVGFPAEFIEIELIPENSDALYLDGISDFGKVTGLPAVKDYTVVAEREIPNNNPESFGLISDREIKNNIELNTFVFEKNRVPYAISFGMSTSVNRDDSLKISYQSKYSYNGESIVVGDTTGNNILLLGAGLINNDIIKEYVKAAVRFLMLFPYSLSEFLLERQLKKYKAGTIYPDMIEFRPVIKSNVPYSSVSYSVNPGEYIAEGSAVTITITLSNETDKLVGVSSNAISDISISGDNGVYEITGKVTKSPQKISIVISSYLTMLGNETLISNETLIKNE